MAIKTYGSVNGLSKEFKGLYGSVNGLSKEIVKLYASVNGISKLIYEKSKMKFMVSHKAIDESDWTTVQCNGWNSVQSTVKDLENSYIARATKWDIKIEEGA